MKMSVYCVVTYSVVRQ